MKRLSFSIILILLIIAASDMPQAKVTGMCSNCHTMHNSQSGAEMATYGGGSGANPCLTRGDCIGCHAYDTTGASVRSIGGSQVPQVWHNGTDLAAGNFKYVAGTDDNKGHNVLAIDQEGTAAMFPPPGDQYGTGITQTGDTALTCAGKYGCHGDRTVIDETTSVKGAHHAGVSGLCDTADTVANSYRFLKGVKGYENMHATYPWQNATSIIHNEYYGVSTRGTESTLSSPGGNSISGLCAECHGDFHGPQSGDITNGTTSPWLRHPTDIFLTNSGEYTNYTTYSVVAPVARTSLGTINTSGTNDKVAPGADIIMCLSCHGAHATNYYKLMRWDNKANMSGCVVCHTSKS